VGVRQCRKNKLAPKSWDRCYDLKNIFAKTFCEKFGVFLKNQCYDANLTKIALGSLNQQR
jgi:hypothetical protein